jgi:hypothetical protein
MSLILVQEFSRHERRSNYPQNSKSISSTTSTHKASLGEHPSTNCVAEDTAARSAVSCPANSVWQMVALFIPSNR